MIEVSNEELNEFCQWFKNHFGKNESYLCAITTCLCGYFHTFPREANLLLKRCKSNNLLEVKRNMVYLK